MKVRHRFTVRTLAIMAGTSLMGLGVEDDSMLSCHLWAIGFGLFVTAWKWKELSEFYNSCRESGLRRHG